MNWFRNKNSEKPTIVTFYFGNSHETFEVTNADFAASLKKVARGSDWNLIVTRLESAKDGSEHFINWSRVNYVKFE